MLYFLVGVIVVALVMNAGLIIGEIKARRNYMRAALVSREKQKELSKNYSRIAVDPTKKIVALNPALQEIYVECDGNGRTFPYSAIRSVNFISPAPSLTMPAGLITDMSLEIGFQDDELPVFTLRTGDLGLISPSALNGIDKEFEEMAACLKHIVATNTGKDVSQAGGFPAVRPTR